MKIVIRETTTITIRTTSTRSLAFYMKEAGINAKPTKPYPDNRILLSSQDQKAIDREMMRLMGLIK